MMMKCWWRSGRLIINFKQKYNCKLKVTYLIKFGGEVNENSADFC